MAGIKISALPAAPSSLLTDVGPFVQGGVTYKETLQQVLTLFNANASFLPLAGGTLTGPLILAADPTLPLGAATKEYVDMFAAGIIVQQAANAGTTANLNTIYANGAAGVGATLTDNSGTFAAFTIDGVSPALNSRILVKNQTTTFQNGVYVLTTNGDGMAIPYVLTRATNYDQAPSEIKPGTLVPVDTGTVNAGTSWLETATVTTVGTDPILFSQFSFSGSSFLLKANNLSDVASVATSLVNLGLGVPTGTGNVVRQTSPTLITPILGAASATSITFSSTSGIIGSTTNDAAAAGSVGEYISSVVIFASAVPLTTNVDANVTSISITAGDWDVWGNIYFNSSIGATRWVGWISTISATTPDPSVQSINNNANGDLYFGAPVPSRRFSVAAPTTVYLSCFVLSNAGTTSACGGIYARRRR